MAVSTTKTLRMLTIASLGLLAAQQALAAGELRGRVIDADSGIFLEGVAISVGGITTTSARGGEYQLRNLPEGNQSVRFQYFGFEPMTEQVVIRPDDAARLDAALRSEFTELEGVVVRADVIGQARALNFQKNNDSYVNVVSADAIGQFPDQNAAEALARLPGVSVERDQGEGRFVVVRGIDPNLNSVAVDGVKLASPSAGDRATLLDTIPSDTLQQIEVYKSVLPSHPGDSVGAYINIKTPSAFDQEGVLGRVTAQTNYSDLVGAWRGKVNGAFGKTYLDGKLGVMIAASREKRTFGSDNNEADPWEEEEGDDGSVGYASGSLAYREYDLTRKRTGLSSNFEFKPSDDALYFFRASWNEYQDTETRNAAVIEPDAFTEIGEGSFVALDSELVREFKDRTEKMGLAAYSIGGENRFENLAIDYQLAYSYAEENTPYDFEIIYPMVDTVDVRFLNTNTQSLGIDQLAGLDMTDPANYEFDEVAVSQQLVEEEDLSGAFNVTHEMGDGILRQVKWGAIYREKEKTSDLEEFASDDNPSEVSSLGAFTFGSARDPFNTNLPLVDPSISRFYQQNESAFAMERADDASALEDFVSREDVFAAYLQAKWLLSDWELIAGARLEETDFETEGFVYNDDTGEISPAVGSNSYSNFLPGVHARKNLSENVVLRLSWNNTLARPSFEQTIPFAEIEGEEVAIGNPNLDPLESMNFDASIEYYLPSLGILSAAVFYKDVDNFIYEQTLFQPFGNIEEAEVTTFRNGAGGRIQGLELAAQSRLDFLPVNGFAAYANLTFVDGEATVSPAEEGDPTRKLPFVKQSEMVGNIALTYEQRGLFLRVAGSWRDQYLDEVGASPLEDRYIDDHFQVDITTSYQISPQLTLFANWLNITDEPLAASWRESRRLSQLEHYGWSANAGLRWTY